MLGNGEGIVKLAYVDVGGINGATTKLQSPNDNGLDGIQLTD